MKTSDFYYELPKELIAQDPLEDRSSSRLMIVDKNTGELQHRHFYEIIQKGSGSSYHCRNDHISNECLFIIVFHL